MGYAQLVIGPAGSGKSTYCSTLYRHCETMRRTMHIVNLDPAAESFDYPVSMDIRELISLDDVMEELGLGPNGGLMYCMEYPLENYADDTFLVEKKPGSKAEETTIDPLAALGKSGAGAVLMVCRTCGKKGDHWTSKCPYKDLAAQAEVFVDRPSATENALPAAASKSTYVPPGMRGGGAERTGTEMRRRNGENSVRVTNLSEDTRKADLHELFRTFGPVSRVYVAIDQKTGVSRGFGFVNFVNKEEAERAINKLNGYGYANLILRVEWATPRAN